MSHGGNQRAREYFKSIGISSLPIPQKYKSRGAHQYAAKLYAECGESFTKPASVADSDIESDNQAQDPQKNTSQSLAHSESSPPEQIKSMNEQTQNTTEEKSNFVRRVQPQGVDTSSMHHHARSRPTPKKTIVKLSNISFDEMLDEDDFDNESDETASVQSPPTPPPRKLVVYESYSNVPKDEDEDNDNVEQYTYNNRSSYGYQPDNNTQTQQAQPFGESALQTVVDVTKNVASAIESAIAPIASAAWEKSKEFSQNLLNIINSDKK